MAAGRGGTGLGAAVGLLNGIWAATAVLGPLAAGLAAQHLSARAAFGLTGIACAAGLVATGAVAGRTRHPARLSGGKPARLRSRARALPVAAPR